MSKPFAVTDDSFEAEVLESGLPVLVDFWAEWCPPCRMIAPSVEQIAAEYEGRLRVAKMNTDENPAVQGRYGVVGIPTLMVFKGGEVVARVTGALPKPRIVAQFEPHLEPTPA